MEKQLAAAAYWIGVVCTVLALIARGLAAMGVWGVPLSGGGGHPGTTPLSYKSFLDGAMLFFVMAIASAVIAWGKRKRHRGGLIGRPSQTVCSTCWADH